MVWIFMHDTDKVEGGLMVPFFGRVFPLLLTLCLSGLKKSVLLLLYDWTMKVSK